MYGEGISKLGEIVDLGVTYDLVKKSGAWFSLAESGERMGQGRDNAKQFLRDHPDIAEDLEAKVRAAIVEAREKAQAERKSRAARPAAQPVGASEKPAEPRRSAAVSIDADDFGEDDI